MGRRVHGGANAKTELTSYLQAKTGKGMHKTDVVYKSKKEGGKFVTTIELPCLGGESHVGEPNENPKDAEQSAAKAVLEAHREEIIELNLNSRPIVIRQTPEGSDNGGGEPKAKKPKTFHGGKDWSMQMPDPSMMMPMMMAMMMGQSMKGKGKGNKW